MTDFTMTSDVVVACKKSWSMIMVNGFWACRKPILFLKKFLVLNVLKCLAVCYTGLLSTKSGKAMLPGGYLKLLRSRSNLYYG